MSAARPICVLKIGGSLLSLPDLPHRIRDVIGDFAGDRPLVVVGGGGIVDVVREWDHVHALGDESAHHLALAGMSVTARLVEQLLDGSTVVDNRNGAEGAWEAGRIPIINAEAWVAGVEAGAARRLPRSWSATSDSISAWIATEIGAKRLVLAKSTAKPTAVADAIRAGQVDAAFADFAPGLPRIDWVNLRDPSPVVERWIIRDDRRDHRADTEALLMAAANVDRDWQGKYQAGDTPWDSGLPSRELQRVLDEQSIVPCRGIELGCGTGTNAVYLASRGFEITGVDCAPLALVQARLKADAADLTVGWIEADVQHFGVGLEPFAFVFDRGCYHCCRRVDLDGYRATLRNVTRPGSRCLILAGNANEQSDGGPPRVTEQQIRAELEDLLDFTFIREFRFQDAGAVDGPLGWSCYGLRRS